MDFEHPEQRREAFKMEREKKYRTMNKARARILAEHTTVFNIENEKREIEAYLNLEDSYEDPRLLKTIDKYKDLYYTCLLEVGLEYDNQEKDLNEAWNDLNSTPEENAYVEFDYQTKNKKDDPEFEFKKQIGDVRAKLLLLNGFLEKDQGSRYREVFVLELIQLLNEHGIEVPKRYNLYVTREVMESWQTEQTKFNAFFQDAQNRALEMIAQAPDPVKQKLIDEGAEPKLAEGIARKKGKETYELVTGSMREVAQKQRAALAELVKEFEDPREFVDILLNLKDGEMPI